ncbi:MAG: c-type cytochrome [Desulfocapsaceae bacterium]
MLKRSTNMIRQFTPVFLLLLVIALLSGCSTPMGNPLDGKRWYSMHHCFSCHGPNGNDGKGPVVKDLTMSFWRFERIIRDAGSPIMPKYPEEKISDQDMADLYAFLKAK